MSVYLILTLAIWIDFDLFGPLLVYSIRVRLETGDVNRVVFGMG